MIPSIRHLRATIDAHLADKEAQGHCTQDSRQRLAALPDSYDALVAFAASLDRLPLRADWPHVEPIALQEIWDECDPQRPLGPVGTIDPAEAAQRVETAFLSCCCGCILGKPLEIDPTLGDLEQVFTRIGEWPLRDYLSEKARPHLAEVMAHGPSYSHDYNACWPECVRERIRFVAPDDDINYTILGMLVLEKHGAAFTRQQLMALWLEHVPVARTHGPERNLLIRAAQASCFPAEEPDFDAWTGVLNPGEERCGAVIRADAYGYACPGRPALAAELAWRDASFTHRRTGVYGAMFVAALMACVQTMRDRGAALRTALQFVPQRSRFARIAADCLRLVETSRDWREAYRRINERYGKYRHCRIYQETGFLMNTLRFAETIGDGICKQVMQGGDTDSFGCTAGSILGAYFGPGHLEERWLRPFNDDLRTGLACFYERSLAAVARRMGRLPALVMAAGTSGPSTGPAQGA